MCLALSASVSAEPPAVDLNVLARNGERSLNRLDAGAASWSLPTTLPSRAKIIVSVARAGPRQRLVFTIDRAGQRAEALRIIVRDRLCASRARSLFPHPPADSFFDANPVVGR